jgi:GNAT superfamily N-acetyltransferase
MNHAMMVDVTTTYLEITSPAGLRPKRSGRADVQMARVQTPMPELNRFLYTAVGGAWYWIDRLPWNYQRWLDYLQRPEVETWLMTVGGVPAGYFELEAQPEGDMEVAYFGLLPQWIGQGLGGHLLTEAVERGFARGARRVWLHTCTLDHPQALANYQARGFRIFRTEVNAKDIAPRPVGPWPGASPAEAS